MAKSTLTSLEQLKLLAQKINTDFTKVSAFNALSARVDGLVSNLNKVHEHANKALLDTYDQTNADIKDAVSKKHSHANAAELDKIATGDKAKWDATSTKVDGIAKGATKVEASATEGNIKINGVETAIVTLATDKAVNDMLTEVFG